jgi:class 3 adenylate cyclase
MPPPADLTPVRARGSDPTVVPLQRDPIPSSATTRTATVTILFTDLSDSTRILTSYGAARSDAIRRDHFSVLRRSVRHWRGEEIKTTGDGLMVVFRSALDAVECSVAMQRGVALLRHADTDTPVVRIGLSAGEAAEEGGDWYGQPVVEAARLCGVAESGQILLTDVVAMLLGTRTRFRIPSVGKRELKGFVSPTAVSEVEWSDEVPTRPMPPAVAAVDGDPFVGRVVELRKAAVVWERARRGARELVLVSGEPGIGKTRLAAELARSAHEEGATVLWGRADESLEVPFQSFVEPLRHFVAHTTPEEVAALVGPRGPDLARLLPELADRLPELQVTSPGDGDADRLEMFEAVATLLNAASRSAPVLLVLDDLHWAPRGSLLLLRHLARDRRRAGLLIVATYRDTDVDDFPAMTELLAELHREPHVEHIQLDGLGAGDVAVLLDQAVGSSRPNADNEDVAALVHAETEGNPFFVGQVIRHLSEVGTVPSAGDPPRTDGRAPESRSSARDDADGPWRASLSDEVREVLVRATEPLLGPSSPRRRSRVATSVRVPEGVRRVVERRLARLTEDTNRLLKVAAVVGHEFELAVLERVPDAAPEGARLLDALDEALRTRLVTELDSASGRLAFTHNLVRQTLLDDLSAARRAHLHRRIAEAMESLPDPGSIRVGSLAHHYCAGASAGTADKAVGYAERAAMAALEQGFFEGAAVHLERALRALTLTSTPEPEVRARLLVARAQTAYLSADVGRSKATAAEAADAARAAGSAKLLARAAWWRSAFPMAGVEDPVTIGLLEEALEAIGDRDPGMRAALLGQLSLYRAINQGQGPVADSIAAEAIDFAHAAEDPIVMARALMARCEVLQGSPDVALQSRLLDELAATAPQLPSRVRSAAEKLALRHRAVVLLQSGDLAGFDRELTALTDIDRNGVDWFDSATVAMWRSLRALMFGRLHEADSSTREMIRHAGDETNFRNTAVAQLYQLRREQGRLGELLEVLDSVVLAGAHLAGFRAALALASAEVGNMGAARLHLQPLAVDEFAGVPWDVSRTPCLALLAETCWLLGAADEVGCLYELLLPHSGQLMVVAWGAVCLGAADRYLGMTAALEGRWAEAERHFEAALALERHLGAEPLAARTQCAYADALSRRGQEEDRGRARELLEGAAATADDLGVAGLSVAVDRARGATWNRSGAPRRGKEE